MSNNIDLIFFNFTYILLVIIVGAFGRIRTLNPQSRNLVFYPVELRTHIKANLMKINFIEYD